MLNQLSIALVGSPNSGKSTLFNSLTGSFSKTANYAGVTVEKKSGSYILENGKNVELIDLPGTYSLDAKTLDEKITVETLSGKLGNHPPDLLLAVADLTNLERNLYLIIQLIETGTPMVLALTMDDLAKKQGIEVDTQLLQEKLQIPVISVSAPKNFGLKDLRKEVSRIIENNLPKRVFTVPDNSSQKIISRYTLIEDILKNVVKRNGKSLVSQKIDRVVLNRFLGPILMIAVFALLFQMIFSFAEAPMSWIEIGIAKIQGLVQTNLHEGLLRSLLADGIIAGVGSVVVFLPQILILFFFIQIFEDSGILARAAFILDRIMKTVGLSGKAFIPLLSSFACAIPAVMATRTIDTKKEKLITMMVIPLMTCSARLPVYAILIGAFIPNEKVWLFFTYQGLTLLGLYLFGIVTAMIVAFVLRRTIFKNESTFFVMELPSYKKPHLKNILFNLKQRAEIFLRRAGTIILGLSILLWFLATFPNNNPPGEIPESQRNAYKLEHSYIGKIGQSFEPVIKPLGYDWKIGIAILSSLAAREVMVSSLSTVYSIDSEDDEKASEELTTKLQTAENMGLATALSLLVFYALSCQCISTIAVIRRETNTWRWPLFAFSYMTLLAYAAAFATYRIALFFIQIH